jgi:multicomponent Na+:H+ antiporter subunit E
VVAGIGVARLAFAPRLALQPGWLNYPLKIPPGPARATFGALTSLVPGTLPVGAGPADTLVYHCLDPSQPVAQGLAADEALLIEAQGGGQTHG